MPLSNKKQPRLSASARLQRDIDLGHTSEEPYITPDKAVDVDIRTPAEKTRLLNWADTYFPIPWDDKILAYWPEKEEAKAYISNEPLAQSLIASEPAQSFVESCITLPFIASEPSAQSFVAREPILRLNTPPSILPSTLVDTPGILCSLGKFTLHSEPSLSPKKRKVSSRKAKKIALNELSFDILDHNERLQAVPRTAIPVPPSMSYGLGSELEQLVHDWEFGQTLVINECFIPLMYWRDIYKTYFPEWWKAIKQDWSRWRASYLT